MKLIVRIVICLFLCKSSHAQSITDTIKLNLPSFCDSYRTIGNKRVLVECFKKNLLLNLHQIRDSQNQIDSCVCFTSNERGNDKVIVSEYKNIGHSLWQEKLYEKSVIKKTTLTAYPKNIIKTDSIVGENFNGSLILYIFNYYQIK